MTSVVARHQSTLVKQQNTTFTGDGRRYFSVDIYDGFIVLKYLNDISSSIVHILFQYCTLNLLKYILAIAYQLFYRTNIAILVRLRRVFE